MIPLAQTLLLVFFLVGCSSGNKNKKVDYLTINSFESVDSEKDVTTEIRQVKDIPQFAETAELIAPGFLFSLHHPSDEKLKGQFRVGFDGMLRLPYGINIDVTGMDFQTLQKRVLEACSKFFQRGSENVSFRLLKKEYWVEVRGFVKKSGYYLVRRKEPIDSVIASAGGLSGNIKSDFFVASIKQQNISYSVSLNQYYEDNVLGTSFTWTGGDTVFINMLNQDSDSHAVPIVSVIGGVQTPGRVLYKEKATLFYYLSKTGGVIPNLGYEESYVIRKVGGEYVSINFDITKMETVPDIKSGDVVMLNAEKKTFADKMWERAIQIGSIITSIAVLIIAL